MWSEDLPKERVYNTNIIQGVEKEKSFSVNAFSFSSLPKHNLIQYSINEIQQPLNMIYQQNITQVIAFYFTTDFIIHDFWRQYQIWLFKRSLFWKSRGGFRIKLYSCMRQVTVFPNGNSDILGLALHNGIAKYSDPNPSKRFLEGFSTMSWRSWVFKILTNIKINDVSNIILPSLFNQISAVLDCW